MSQQLCTWNDASWIFVIYILIKKKFPLLVLIPAYALDCYNVLFLWLLRGDEQKRSRILFITECSIVPVCFLMYQ